MTENTKKTAGQVSGTNKRLHIHLDRRKLLFIVPIAVILLGLTGYGLYEWQNSKAEKAAPKKGINTALPAAQFTEKEPEGKMAYYDKARQDSTHNDTAGLSYAAEKMGFGKRPDDQTARITEKLAAINREINTPYVAPKTYAPGLPVSSVQQAAPISKDVDRLETLMKNMQEHSGADDPEMVQLNTMMDKILQIQNPDIVRNEVKAMVPPAADTLFKTISAEIASAQKVTQGSVVEIRLLDSVLLNGQRIPKGHTLFGLASFSNQRMNLEIKNIRLGNQVIPVNLTVYDKRDAMVGIFAPEALLSEAIASGGSGAIGSLGISGFDLTTQLAGAGIDAAKSLLTKKIKRIKQPLKGGYPLLIRDNAVKTTR
ncbi:MAG: conjugative transposon protein TraM [Bacteroidota bacterium]